MSIVATSGPALMRVFNKDLANKITILRENMSHGDWDEHRERVEKYRELSDNPQVLIDLQWPKIRLGKFPDGKVTYKKWDTATLSFNMEKIDTCDKNNLYVSIPQITEDVQVGNTLKFNDGFISATVVSKEDDHHLTIEFLSDGCLSSNKGINSSDASLNVSPLTEKDIHDLDFAKLVNAEFVAISFVRQADDIRELRKLMNDRGMQNTKIIAKVERHEAVGAELDNIAAETDVIMIARGDLAVEIPDMTYLPLFQEKMINVAHVYGTDVIWATQVLESMTNLPRPTNAEITDLHAAITKWADYTMLSGETAMGDFPDKAINFMTDMWNMYRTNR